MPLNLSSGEMRSFVDFIEGNVGEPPPHGAGEWRSRVCPEGPALALAHRFTRLVCGDAASIM